MKNCINCHHEVSSNFCSNCGHPTAPKRIDRQFVTGEISKVVNFDRGIFYTIKELILRPGDTANRFIKGDRKKLVKPILFLIICSLLYTIAKQFLSFEIIDIKFSVGGQDSFVLKLYEWFSHNYGYTNILMAIFIAMWIRVFFRKQNYNYYEVYILLCYIMGISVLIYTLIGIIENISGFSIMQFNLIIVLIYSTWGIAQFFDKRKTINYVKGILSYVFGVVSSFILFFAIGIGLDILFDLPT